MDSRGRASIGFVVVLVLLIVSVVGNIFLGVTWYQQHEQLKIVSAREASNTAIISFQKLFVSKVLTTQGNVSPEDRLKLEQAVVNTNDKDIQSAWQTFLASTTEAEAQQNVLTLLTLFANKLQ